MDAYHVYVRTDETERIVEIGSDAFLTDVDGMQLIDSGYGDKYLHAQRNYLTKPLQTADGRWRYKLQDGAPVERTADELASDGSTATAGTLEERVSALEQKVNEEMADQQEALAELGVSVNG